MIRPTVIHSPHPAFTGEAACLLKYWPHDGKTEHRVAVNGEQVTCQTCKKLEAKREVDNT